MPTAVQFATSVALNGELYVIGGNNGTNYVANVQVYDPHKNKWKTLASLPSAIGFSGGAVAYGLVFMEGGYSGAGSDATNQYMAVAPSIP